MNINDKSGWLFNADTKNTHDVSLDELQMLLELAKAEDQWAENVKQEIEYNDAYPRASGIDFLFNDVRIMNGEGAIVQFPFGYICTFRSRRHLFRGEVQDYDFSEASLSRRCRRKSGEKRSPREIELLHTIANMRIAQFRKFIWQFDIIPQWEGKLSEVNYKALAQHYGFETFLLDLTNDVRNALFFATCKWEKDHFEPLAEKDIKQSERSKYGVIYHTPDWKIDFLNGISFLKLQASFEKERGRSRPSVIDTGLWDGVAYQIGLQPFYRCHTQSGYVYPMKTMDDIRHNGQFERIRFPQTVEFSNQIFQMMDEGKKIYPEEGITQTMGILEQMRRTLIFSEDDLLWAYELDEADKKEFSSVDQLRATLQSGEMAHLIEDAYGVDNGQILITPNEVEYPLSENIINSINTYYNDKSFLAPIGEKLYMKPDAKKYRKLRYFQIFGEEMDEEIAQLFS